MKILIEESVLREALEALNIACDWKFSDWQKERKDAITALCSALDAAEKVEPVAWMDTKQVITYGQHNLSDIPLFTHPPTIDPLSKCPNCGAPLICNKCTHPAPAVPEETK